MRLAGLSLAQLLLLLGVASALTVALYMLRRRQQRVAVPFIGLWEGVLRDREASRLFARLRHLLSLLLALSIVALLGIAVADPRREAAADSERNVVLIIDAGVTMQATDVAPSRFAAALAEARRFVAGAGPALRVLVAQMDASATPLSPFSAEPRLLDQALAGLAPTDLESDPQRAYRFALDVLAGRPGAEIVLLSDAAPPPEPAIAAAFAKTGTRLSYLPIGRRSHNLAISAFAVRRYPLDRNRSELLIELTSASPHPEQVELTLLGDGVAIDVQRLQLEPGATLRRSYDDVTGVSRTLEARIAAAAGHDDLAADDRAYATLPERKRMRVLCVTDGNRYLEAALLLDEYLDVDRIGTAAYRDAAGYDAVIFDRFAPSSPPQAPALYMNAEGAGAPLAVTGRLERPRFERLQTKHPLLRFTALRDVNVSEALLMRAQPDDEVLAADPRGPLVVAGTRAGQRFAALGFDIGASDLPLRAAWPLLLLNALDWFTSAEHEYRSATPVGRSLRIELPQGVDQLDVREPGGAERSLRAARGELALTPGRAGFYHVRYRGEERVLAVNLAPATRRDLAPTPPPRLGQRKVARPALPAPALHQPPWVLLALAAALLLLAEWLTYHRRVTL